jgi:hypothetical protein
LREDIVRLDAGKKCSSFFVVFGFNFTSLLVYTETKGLYQCLVLAGQAPGEHYLSCGAPQGELVKVHHRHTPVWLYIELVVRREDGTAFGGLIEGLEFIKDRMCLSVEHFYRLVHVDAVHPVLVPLSIPGSRYKEDLEAQLMAQGARPLLCPRLLLCCERARALLRSAVPMNLFDDNRWVLRIENLSVGAFHSDGVVRSAFSPHIHTFNFG